MSSSENVYRLTVSKLQIFFVPEQPNCFSSCIDFALLNKTFRATKDSDETGINEETADFTFSHEYIFWSKSSD